jgi:uncharacterized delta-60 repeat protein
MAAAGDLDPTYGNGGKVTNDFFGFDDLILAAAIQPDGKIVVAGIIQLETNVFRRTVARYKLDGSLDPTFGTDGKVLFSLFEINTVDLQPDGKIVLAGSIEKDFALLRFNCNGSLDTTFGNSGSVRGNLVDPEGFDSVQSVAIQADGKIVAAGFADSGNFLAVTRLNANGSLDTSFGNGGTATPGMGPGFEQASAVEIQPDSKIVVAGRIDRSAQFGRQDFGVARFNSNGELDETFGNAGRAITEIGSGQSTVDVRDLAIQADGNILVAGVADFKFALVRYDSDGFPDGGFGTGGKVLGPDGAVAAIVIQCDGKIVAASSSSSSGSLMTLARYNTNGTLDNSFGNLGVVTTDFGGSAHANALVLQPDCKIVAAGVNRRSGIPDDFALARYLTASTNAPVLQTEANTDDALALDSVTFVRVPFSVNNEHNFSADGRTRIVLLATNLTLASGENSSAVTVQAQASGGAIHQLAVEHVGQVPGFEWLTQVVVKLPDALANAGTVQVSITHGNTSNQGSIFIK